MSRGQSTQAFNTASNENATDFGNAQSAFGSTEDAIGNYNNQLAKFVSGNPYTPGGEYDQTLNTGLANVSDAGANSLAGALQAQARRTGPAAPDGKPTFGQRDIRRGFHLGGGGYAINTFRYDPSQPQFSLPFAFDGPFTNDPGGDPSIRRRRTTTRVPK